MPENNPTIALAESYADMAIARLNELVEERDSKFIEYELKIAQQKGYIQCIEEILKYQTSIIENFAAFYKKANYLIEQNSNDLPEYYANEMYLLSNFTADKIIDIESVFEEMKKRTIEEKERAAARAVAKAEGSS